MYKDFLNILHKSTKRDYLARVNDKEFPKYKAAKLAKKWAYHYWDGSRKINYGGYKYIQGRWYPVIRKMIKFYNLKKNCRILDVGCGKGFFLKDFKDLLPDADVYGLDISKYAIKNSHQKIKNKLKIGSATKLPWKDDYFDLVVSFNTLHNLYNYELEQALIEISRVTKKKSYICVESYKNEEEKMNLLYWQVTCESFYTPKEWSWWFKKTKYKGDYSYIYFK
ncbi:class I SAM-dependent methyltransferase [Candidatus Pelagibacter sp.]|nr:class I SAM-dependent methyltransferase [Candidatus Pelagibacter sp.]|tara:strand:- start:2050 stop:2718 length:669 start_codon:yes stop_codon:yes gene_type:complete